MATLGTRIKTMRLSRGLSQVELAKKIGASRSAVTMWENDLRRPSLDMFDALADVFNVPIYAIMEDEKAQQEDDELWELRESMRRNPDMKVLFSLTKNAKPKAIRQAIAVIKALNEDEEY